MHCGPYPVPTGHNVKMPTDDKGAGSGLKPVHYAPSFPLPKGASRACPPRSTPEEAVQGADPPPVLNLPCSPVLTLYDFLPARSASQLPTSLLMPLGAICLGTSGSHRKMSGCLPVSICCVTDTI